MSFIKCPLPLMVSGTCTNLIILHFLSEEFIDRKVKGMEEEKRNEEKEKEETRNSQPLQKSMRKRELYHSLKACETPVLPIKKY